MQYWGKIFCVAFSMTMGSGFWGTILGLIIGHFLDKISHCKFSWFSSQNERQALFFTITFEVMGHLSKSKGQVTKADIRVANIFMDRMNLHGESRKAAQNAFRIGKSDNYPLREKIRQFHSICFGQLDLIRMFLDIQVQTAFADGSLHPNERDVLYTIAEELGVSRSQFDQFFSTMRNHSKFYGNDKQQKQDSNSWQQAKNRSSLENAYNILGVQPHDNMITIKRAYRKLMSEHHPDKLVAKGLSSDKIEIAKQKAQNIQKAYELIKKQKGLYKNAKS